jgi:hypothetical protein
VAEARTLRAQGEGALRILAPVTLKRTEGPEDADQRRVFFKTAFVFDVSQTEPLPGVQPVALEPPREPVPVAPRARGRS